MTSIRNVRLSGLLVLLVLALPVAAQVGSLDLAFDGDGVRVDSFDVKDQVWDVLALPDGSVLTFGSSEGDGPTTRDARLTRYVPDGTLAWSWTDSFDGCFGGPGTPGAYFDGVLEPDGRILTASYNQYGCSGPARDFVLRRVDPVNGSVLAEAERPVFHGFSDEPWGGLVRLPDGKVVVAGYASSDATSASTTRDLAFVRYNADFTIDATFGTDGEVLIDIAGDYDFVYDIALQTDGKIVGTGFTYDEGQSDWLLFRLNPDGSLDDTFGTGGLVIQDFFGFNDNTRNLVLQPDGKIVVAGSHRLADDTTVLFTVARYDPDGSLDASFGTGGQVTVDFNGLLAAARDVVLQPDGKLLVAGFTETGEGGTDTYDMAVARFHPDGSLDDTFGTDGWTIADASGVFDSVQGAALTPDGNLVVVGYTVRDDGGGTTLNDAVLARFIGGASTVANEPEGDATAAAMLQAPYPNPFRGRATLRYDVPEASRVRLVVCDMLGREVAVLVDAERRAGRYNATFEADGLASGLYVVRMTAGEGTEHRRVTLLR